MHSLFAHLLFYFFMYFVVKFWQEFKFLIHPWCYEVINLKYQQFFPYVVHSSRDQFAGFFHVHLIYSSLFMFFKRPHINLSEALFYFLHSLRYEDVMLVSHGVALAALASPPFPGPVRGTWQHRTACSSGSGRSSSALLLLLLWVREVHHRFFFSFKDFFFFPESDSINFIAEGILRGHFQVALVMDDRSDALAVAQM